MKKLLKNKTQCKAYIIVLFTISLFIFQIYYVNSIKKNLLDKQYQGNILVSSEVNGTKQWIENPNFTSPIGLTWYSIEEGEKSDVQATTSGEQANFKVLGEQGTFSNISGIPKNISVNYPYGWTAVNNTAFPAFPDIYKIDSCGCYISHTWDDNDALQTPSVHWDRNITMPVDMSEYIITSADLKIVINASVDSNIDTPNDNNIGFTIGDSVRFYVLISDVDKKFPIEVVYFKTIYLGQRNLPTYEEILNITDKTLRASEKSLIDALTSVFEINHYNFTITLGIDIFCEDNIPASDHDHWDDLRIKSCNLTFSYEKKINKLTFVSWNQDGDKISDLSPNRVIISNAMLNFKYKVNQDWSTSSPNSEIKVFINNKEHTETIKLSSATTSFQKIKSNGFNVTYLISDDVNLSLQVFLADDFGLNRTIIVLIDEVSLDISYVIIIPDEPGVDWTLLIIILIASIAGLVITFSLYQTHFKYPPIVRKMRKLRKKIKKGKTAKQILLKKRQELIKNGSKEQIKILNFDSIIPEKTGKVEKIKGINKSEK